MGDLGQKACPVVSVCIRSRHSFFHISANKTCISSAAHDSNCSSRLLFRKKALFPALLIFLILFGMLRGSVFHYRENPLIKFVDKEITLRGIVKGAPQADENRVLYIVETVFVKTGDQIYPVKAKIRVSVYPDSYDEKAKVLKVYQTGDLVEATGTLKEPNGPRNPKGFDYKTYLKRRGIYSIISVKEKNIDLVRQVKGLSWTGFLPYSAIKHRRCWKIPSAGGKAISSRLFCLGSAGLLSLNRRMLLQNRPGAYPGYFRAAHRLSGSIVKITSICLKLQRGRAFMLQSIILPLLPDDRRFTFSHQGCHHVSYLSWRKSLGQKKRYNQQCRHGCFHHIVNPPNGYSGNQLSIVLYKRLFHSIALRSYPESAEIPAKTGLGLIAASMAAQSGTLP